MKMKKILKMPLRRMQRRPAPAEALRAKATTSSGTYEKEDYEIEQEEPNMKFSHALLVVLALHVIAVGGVFAFNSIKAGQAAAAKNSAKEEIARAAAQTSAQPKPSAPDNVIEGWQGRTHTVQAGDTLSRLASLYKTTIEAIENENGITTYSMIRVGQVLKIPAAKPETPKPASAATPPPKSAVQSSAPNNQEVPPAATDGNTYTVAKGDNPYSIAKKLHVSYNELIAINDIKDPTRVQIGQKLKIPPQKK